ncbi:MAG: TIGR03936 family radical SAM-associated protein [Fretibacterium sp.]|nr:TIGR03936 family radical SAM-associated protein [Fretibacterium sp.]
MSRVRLIYEKRGGACFVPHVSLASLFTRAALRAGLRLARTQGFSPHPRMSFGPELPAGVVALAEPVDVWLEGVPDGLLERWNAALPDGFRLRDAWLVEEDEAPGGGLPSLGKLCQAALYWVRGAGGLDALLAAARAFYGPSVLAAEGRGDWLSLTLAAPAQNGVGGWVKRMSADGTITGWQDLNIVRAAIGRPDLTAHDAGLVAGTRLTLR